MSLKRQKEKLFIVRKYILAKSCAEAIKKDKMAPVDDCWIDDEWKKGNHNELASAIGFVVQNENKEEL